MKKTISLISVFILSLMLLIGCDLSGNEPDNNTDEGTKYRVTLVPTAGATVESTNPLEVSAGATAEFKINLGKTCVFRNATAGGKSVGFYDFKTGKFTVGNVTADMRIEFTVEDVGYPTGFGYTFEFKGTSSDSASHNNAMYQAGTRITVKAGLASGSFAGWSEGGRLDDGGTLLSPDREYTFELKKNLVLYPNYVDSNVYYYDVNGGMINASSRNLSSTLYYTATVTDGIAKVAMNQDYLDEIGCASTFWDDGSFTKVGHVLKEYNTRPDGTGEGFSLGSKFPMNLESTTLYCIWEAETSHADFEYEDYSFARPESISASYAPDWNENGVIVKKYNGDAKAVTIPEKLGGKPVIAIASDAFVNKSVETLIISKTVLLVEDGAFVGCNKLKTIYYPDGIYSIGNGALDSASYSNFKNLYVNATIAPRCSSGDAFFAKKFTRLLANSDKNRIIVIAGSSAYTGLSSPYMEALLDSEYTVVNFGTTRTTHGYMYLEAMQYYAHENDIILYAPENSAYMMGEPTLYYKTLRDVEGMYNIFRHIDISKYENVFGAFCDFNRGLSVEEGADFAWTARYERAPGTYEQIIVPDQIDKYGEYHYSKRQDYYKEENYKDAYLVTLNNRFKSRFEGAWNKVENQKQNMDYTDESNITWCSIDDPRYKDQMNRVIDLAKSSGAKVYFSFCPVDYSSLCDEAKADPATWFAAYDKFILDTYCFDGIMGTSGDYVMNRRYFHDCAFHPNDYGRTYRTYTLYRDLCKSLGITDVKGIYDVGQSFDGCLFETGSDGKPIMPAY